jgi:hypothetical protein
MIFIIHKFIVIFIVNIILFVIEKFIGIILIQFIVNIIILIELNFKLMVLLLL